MTSTNSTGYHSTEFSVGFRMKGFTKDNKFHPITDYKGVRKSRDQTTKTEGIRTTSIVRKKSDVVSLDEGRSMLTNLASDLSELNDEFSRELNNDEKNTLKNAVNVIETIRDKKLKKFIEQEEKESEKDSQGIF